MAQTVKLVVWAAVAEQLAPCPPRHGPVVLAVAVTSA